MYQGARRENMADIRASSNPPSPRLRRDQAKARLRATAGAAKPEAPDAAAALGWGRDAAPAQCGRTFTAGCQRFRPLQQVCAEEAEPGSAVVWKPASRAIPGCSRRNAFASGARRGKFARATGDIVRLLTVERFLTLLLKDPHYGQV